MYTRWSPLVSAGIVPFAIVTGAAHAGAQAPSPQDGEKQEDQGHNMANMPGMQHDASQRDMSMREGSGTSWLPDEVGEPALGPVAFMHRVSALPNPLAPATHHWFDATHIAYGVATAGLYGAKWKAEGSVFNGREPDETRTSFDFAAMDSWSGRFWFLPVGQCALQVSAGRLTDAESGHDGGPRIDVDRVTASATYHLAIGQESIWATTIGWGRNAQRGADATNAALAETSLTLKDRDHDLDVQGNPAVQDRKSPGWLHPLRRNMEGPEAGHWCHDLERVRARRAEACLWQSRQCRIRRVPDASPGRDDHAILSVSSRGDAFRRTVELRQT